MGLKPAQGELNTALAPLFMHIKDVHLIHDDLVIATKTEKEHESTLRLVMEAISDAGVTLNPSKYVIGAKEIEFWGMLTSSNGIRPNPAEVAALNQITPPNNKEELTSFLCMMQANAEFMPNLSQKSAVLRELTWGNKQFQWTDIHMACFDNLLQEFRDRTILRYFDPVKSTFILVDAHVTGLGATLVIISTLCTLLLSHHGLPRGRNSVSSTGLRGNEYRLWAPSLLQLYLRITRGNYCDHRP